jgi:lysophospholipase L1-like esterase
MRSTLRVTCSDNWETGSIMDRGRSKYSFGIAGRYFEPAVDLKRPKNGDTTRWMSSGASWVAFQPWRRTFDKSGYAHLNLYVQNVSGFAEVEYSCDDDSALTDTIPVGAGVQRLTLETPADEKILLRFHCSSPLTVDGVSFDSDSGIIVDNFPSRGNGGLALNRISDSVLTSYAKFLDYRLIILEYGANIATDDTLLERTNYERVFTSVIKRLRSDFPNADVLVIGAADKSFNSEHGYRTALSIPYIMKAQKNAAEKMHCAFWNLFDVMGGENSMPSWVQNGYAAKDYTHFSVTGSRIIGNLLAKAFLYEYQRPSVAIP